MTTYKVTARRWELGWELHIEGIGVTQAATLASAGRMVRDYVAALTGTDPGEIAVDYRIELDEDQIGSAAYGGALHRGFRRFVGELQRTARRVV